MRAIARVLAHSSAIELVALSVRAQGSHRDTVVTRRIGGGD
jgi:hypothetical protein